MNTILEQIHNGMKVYDDSHDKVGTVNYVKYGDEDPTVPGAETATARAAVAEDRDTLVDDIAAVFRPDDLPEELRERLLRNGFIRIDAAGLFKSDRYVMPDQIESVSEDNVQLKISKSELIKRS